MQRTPILTCWVVFFVDWQIFFKQQGYVLKRCVVRSVPQRQLFIAVLHFDVSSGEKIPEKFQCQPAGELLSKETRCGRRKVIPQSIAAAASSTMEIS